MGLVYPISSLANFLSLNFFTKLTGLVMWKGSWSINGQAFNKSLYHKKCNHPNAFEVSKSRLFITQISKCECFLCTSRVVVVVRSVVGLQFYLL